MANIRNRYLLVSDLLLLAAAPFVAYAIRFEGILWTAPDEHTASVYAVLSLVLKLVVFLPFGFYSRLWRHASIPDLAKILQATALSAAVCAALGLIALPASRLTAGRVPISVIMLDAFLTVTAVSPPRPFVPGPRPPHNPPRGSRGRPAPVLGARAPRGKHFREGLTQPPPHPPPLGV